MKKSGFTLIEMLIVVVIIGILSSALIPRLTGYLAKTRDLKRQADLRNIAAAIEMYRNDHGELPPRVHQNLSFLSDYLNGTPKDPNKNTLIPFDIFGCSSPQSENCKLARQYLYSYTGEYLYWKNLATNRIFLIAKVETQEGANFVKNISHLQFLGAGAEQANCQYVSPDLGGVMGKLCRSDIWNFPLCTSIKKGKTADMIIESGNINCTYNSADQLYYIVKIE